MDETIATDRVFQTFLGDINTGLPINTTIRITDNGDPNDGLITIDDGGLGQFELHTFRAPTGSLTIESGDGNDTILPLSFDNAFTGELTIDGGVGSDTVDGTNSNFERPIEFISIETITPLGFGDAAPQILDVIVGGSGWNPAFVDAIDGGGTGAGNGLGFSLVGTQQLGTIPWTGVDQIFLVFNEDVSASLADGDIRLTGTNGGTYALGPLTFGVAGSNIATVPVTAGIAIDSLVLTIFDGTITDAVTNALDGEWTSGQSSPSGNSIRGGRFDFFFNALPGDEDGSGQVNIADALAIFSSNTMATTTVLSRRDINGSGQITTIDALLAFANNTFGLPAAPTPLAALAPPISQTTSLDPTKLGYLEAYDAAISGPQTVRQSVGPARLRKEFPVEPPAPRVAPCSQSNKLRHADESHDDYAATVDEAISQFSDETEEEDRLRSPLTVGITNEF